MEPMRAIGTNAIVFSAMDIPRYGFGQTEVTRRTGNSMVTEIVPRIYRLCCRCCIQEHKDCGGVCEFCRLELETIQSSCSCGEGLSPEQLDWAATPCRSHHYVCKYPFCAVSGCHRHIAVAADGQRYCRSHFQEINHTLKFAETSDRYGVVPAKSFDFIQSLFFDR